MFQLFRKKRPSSHPKNPETDKIGNILAKTIYKVQTRWATSLSQAESRLSVRQKKWALWIFCAGMSFWSAHCIYEGIFSPASGKAGYLKQQMITAPRKTQLPDSLDLQLLKQFQQRRAKIDSLPDSLKR